MVRVGVVEGEQAAAWLVGLLEGPFTSFLVMWMPMLVFELAVAFWLLIKGAAAPARISSAMKAA